MTEADLARKLKKSRSSVNEWCSGEHAPRLPMLVKIAKAIPGCSLEQLVS